MRLPLLASLFAFLAIAAPTWTATAAEPAKPGFDLGQEGVWSSQCEIDRMIDFRACRVVAHRLFDDGQQQGFIAVSIVPPGNDYHLFVTSNGGKLQLCASRVDRQPRIESQIATFNMCMFPNFQSGRTVDQFKNGSSVLIRLNYLRGGRRDIDFPLVGFSKAFDEMHRLSQ
ncbi:hypothetical protein JZU48_01605 [bacterium]|nr:hypothetical protein [bacterium]